MDELTPSGSNTSLHKIGQSKGKERRAEVAPSESAQSFQEKKRFFSRNKSAPVAQQFAPGQYPSSQQFSQPGGVAARSSTASVATQSPALSEARIC